LTEKYLETATSSVNTTLPASKTPSQRSHSGRDANFEELLAHFDAEEHVIIQTKIFDIVRNEIHKQVIREEEPITAAEVKEILKNHSLSTFYPNRFQITTQLNAQPFPVMSEEHKNTLRSKFNLTKTPFNKYKGSRNNYLNRPLVFKGLCQLEEGLEEFAEIHNSLKSNNKTSVQIEIFNKICAENGWESGLDLR
jgi:hypothetical protein